MIPLRTLRPLLPAAAAVLLAACAEPPVERPIAQPARLRANLTQQTSLGPRVPGLPGHARQLAWLRRGLGLRADTVLEQRFTHRTAAGETIELSNVLARFRPEEPRRILLAAHWDTRRLPEDGEEGRFVPGANDGASGPAVLMELAELFRRVPPPVGVDLLFLDGSDVGDTPADAHLGARHFTKNLPEGYPPEAAVVLHLVGEPAPRFAVEAHSQRAAAPVVRRVWDTAETLGFSHVFLDVPGETLADDHVVLQKAGIPAVLVSDPEYGEGNHLWHSPLDLVSAVDVESLRVVTEVLAAVVYGMEEGS